jgi:phosphatidate phosphatase PAH1
MQEALNRSITGQTSLGKKQDPISKITRTKRAGGIVQVVECLPSKHEALNQISIPQKKKKKKKYKPVKDNGKTRIRWK